MRSRRTLGPLTAALLALAAVAGCAGRRAERPPPPPVVDASPGTFEAPLSAYGEWMVVEPYGRVWRPGAVDPGWQPYLHGEWVWSTEGWLWVSDEPWGWATYHYGRWAFEPGFGWFWVPGYEWAPAWVSWRYGGGFVGWTALPPGHHVGWAGPYVRDPGYWVFVPVGSFVGVPVSTVALPRTRVPRVIDRTRPAPPGDGGRPTPGRAPRGGPPPAEVERHAGRPLAPVRVAPVATPEEARARGGPGTEPVFRPGAAERGSSAARPAPAPAPDRAAGARTPEGRADAAPAPPARAPSAAPRSPAASPPDAAPPAEPPAQVAPPDVRPGRPVPAPAPAPAPSGGGRPAPTPAPAPSAAPAPSDGGRSAPSPAPER